MWRVEQVQPPFRAITSHPATAPATATTTATATATAAAAAAVDDTASTSTGELKANATQANLLASSTMTGEEVAATAAAPIMAVVAVNAHVRLSGVAVMPPLSNDVKVWFILLNHLIFLFIVTSLSHFHCVRFLKMITFRSIINFLTSCFLF